MRVEYDIQNKCKKELDTAIILIQSDDFIRTSIIPVFNIILFTLWRQVLSD